ncbi:MAG: DUF1631 family protein [Ramlibacter sp.]
MSAASPDSTSAYRACIKEAAAQGRDLMQRAIGRVRASLDDRAARAAGPAQRQQVHEAVDLLARHAPVLSTAYPQVLLDAFTQAIAGSAPQRAGSGAGSLSFADLELVNDDQLQESVELVRTQHSVDVAVEAELVQLNALVCAAQGLRTVQSDRNPLRPDTYVRSLRTVVQQSPVPAAIRVRWLQMLGEALGPELAQDYQRLAAFLRTEGVSEAGFEIVAAPPAHAAATGAGTGAKPQGAALTVRALQQLLAGESGTPGGPGGPGPAATESAPATDFAETVPAAHQVLQEMREVGSLVRRVRERRQAGAAAPLQRAASQDQALRPGQAVALQVVGLMVENIAGDPRLLPAVRAAVRALEPALLRLALDDPRFFSDRRHPARRLLDEITTRSLAWQSEDEPGFDRFVGPLREAVDALVSTHVAGAEPYEFARQTLEDTWNRDQSRERRQREKAVRALLKAEQRNLLASRLAAEIEGRADLELAPPEVVALLLGPWAQVMAYAQLADTGGEHDPGGFRALVPELLWSVLPHTSPAAASRLGKRLPLLLETLRRGLELVGFTQVQVRRLLERLAELHQQALKGQGPERGEGDARARGREALDRLLGPGTQEGDSWLAPAEAQQTGFMDSALASRPLFQPTQPAPGRTPVHGAGGVLPLGLVNGSWVELLLEGEWSRWQLTWVSPHRTLLMFTGAQGTTRSMTPKLVASMAQGGLLRLVSAQAVVDGALDAVAGTALLNSAGIAKP